MALTWEAPLTCWGHFSPQTPTCTHSSDLVKITLAYEWTKSSCHTTSSMTSKTPETLLSPKLWCSIVQTLEGWTGMRLFMSQTHQSTHSCRHNTWFQVAISTTLGTRCWVSVVLGWTPHPDTWQAMLPWPCRHTGRFWRCSLLLWLTLWIQECC